MSFPLPRSTTRPAGGLAARHLSDLGRPPHRLRRRAEDRPVTLERMSGYLAVMAEAGLEPIAFHGRPSRGLRTRYRGSCLRAVHPEIDAAICFSDLVALGMLSGFAQAGRPAGLDFRVVGFDDIEECALAGRSSARFAATSRVRPAFRRGHADLAGSRRAASRHAPRPRATGRAPLEPWDMTCPDFPTRGLSPRRCSIARSRRRTRCAAGPPPAAAPGAASWWSAPAKPRPGWPRRWRPPGALRGARHHPLRPRPPLPGDRDR